MVSQVPIIGIFMIVNGVICLLYGSLLAALGPFMQTILDMQGAQRPPAQPGQPDMKHMMTFITILYGVLGGASIIAGAMNIAGGIAALRFRSRAFVIVALFFNVLSFGTCYCLPTSLGLMIWGLIVMFQQEMSEAFALGAAGHSAGEIKERMSRAHDRRRRDDDEFDDDGSSRGERDDRPPPSGPGEEGIREL